MKIGSVAEAKRLVHALAWLDSDLEEVAICRTTHALPNGLVILCRDELCDDAMIAAIERAARDEIERRRRAVLARLADLGVET